MNCGTDNEDFKLHFNKTHETSILKLNDDCLEIICKQLTSKDQVSFALTCGRFYNVMKTISKIQYFCVNTDIFLYWPHETIKMFLQIAGAHIKVLTFRYTSEPTILNDLSSICKNVRKLTLQNRRFNTDTVISLTENMKQLEDLEIIYTNIEDEDFFKYLKRFKCLKKFSLKEINHINGLDLSHLSDLQALTISSCNDINSEILEDICLKHRNLSYLDIKHSIYLKLHDCENILANLLQLETLKVSCFVDDSNCLIRLPKLKILHIQFPFPKTISFFDDLAQSKCDQLEELVLETFEMGKEVYVSVSKLKKLKVLHIICEEIYNESLVLLANLKDLIELKLSSCHLVTDGAVLNIFESCLKLQQLDLANCDRLSRSFFEETKKLLRKQRTQNIRKNRIVMTGTVQNHFCFQERIPNLLDITLKDNTICFSDPDADTYELNWE